MSMFTPGRAGDYYDERVCLSVRLSASISGTTRPIFGIFVNVTFYGCRLVILWRCRDMLCNSGLWVASYLQIMGHMQACWYRCNEWCQCVVACRLTPLLLTCFWKRICSCDRRRLYFCQRDNSISSGGLEHSKLSETRNWGKPKLSEMVM